MAVGAPSRALRRRINAPMAVLLCIAPWAASRNIAAARFLVFLGLELSSLPPLIRLSGQSLSQEQKCVSLFELLKLLLNLVFPFRDLQLIGIIEFERRLQGEEMLGSVISF